ncbi:MAG: hypothetical protein JO100_19275 [Pseudonocardia sp.]|nr:hypothetical protein [Pseudonocardia sp.]
MITRWIWLAPAWIRNTLINPVLAADQRLGVNLDAVEVSVGGPDWLIRRVVGC